MRSVFDFALSAPDTLKVAFDYGYGAASSAAPTAASPPASATREPPSKGSLPREAWEVWQKLLWRREAGGRYASGGRSVAVAPQQVVAPHVDWVPEVAQKPGSSVKSRPHAVSAKVIFAFSAAPLSFSDANSSLSLSGAKYSTT